MTCIIIIYNGEGQTSPSLQKPAHPLNIRVLYSQHSVLRTIRLTTRMAPQSQEGKQERSIGTQRENGLLYAVSKVLRLEKQFLVSYKGCIM